MGGEGQLHLTSGRWLIVLGVLAVLTGACLVLIWLDRLDDDDDIDWTA